MKGVSEEKSLRIGSTSVGKEVNDILHTEG